MQQESKELDVLVIGDITVDAFIRLKEAHLNCNVDNSNCQICMDFGSKIPYQEVHIIPGVGNSPNAAVSASRLGLKSGILTFAGNDVNGRECEFSLKNEGVDTSNFIIENGKTTNYHYVLWFNDERTILIKHEAYKAYMPDIKKPKWIYLSSLGEYAEDFHKDIEKYLLNNSDVKFAFQPGTFQIRMGYEKLKTLYARTEYFCCNVEEAQAILKTDIRDVSWLLDQVSSLGPKIITITDGPKGAYMRDQNGLKYFIPAYKDPKAPLERTGAGDAFTSTFMSFLIIGEEPVDALKYAPINSMNVVQHVGAQEGLLVMSEIKRLHYVADKSYFPIRIA
jgi:sugar/nucleoside kinase (ribokinase family)